jgi:hypothetical protein
MLSDCHLLCVICCLLCSSYSFYVFNFRVMFVCFFCFHFLCSVFFVLFSVQVLCPLVCIVACLFSISVQLHLPLPPGGNPVAVNKYNITNGADLFNTRPFRCISC